MNEIKTNDVEAVKEEVVEVIDTPTEETDTKKKKKDSLNTTISICRDPSFL